LVDGQISVFSGCASASAQTRSKSANVGSSSTKAKAKAALLAASKNRANDKGLSCANSVEPVFTKDRMGRFRKTTLAWFSPKLGIPRFLSCVLLI